MDPIYRLYIYYTNGATADGRNPAPVDMEKLPLFAGFYLSQVVQDFFHQQSNQQYYPDKWPESNVYITGVGFPLQVELWGPT